MKTLYRTAVGLAVIAFLFCATNCNNKKDTNDKFKNYAFTVKGVSGNDVMLDRTWYRECISGGNGSWDKSIRTLSGKELATIVTNYRNNSKTPACDSGAQMITVFVQTITNDNIRVPITWVDAEGKPSTPPAGLENVKEGNGASGTVTYATCTPLTKEQAAGLNYVKFGGYTDWSAGVTKDILPYFQAIGTAKGTIIVDDRTSTGAVYDGISTNPKEYPTMVSNTPHKGPLNGIKF